ncbi:hypothetical protein OVS_00815 [Mycoplasma ovis str. Michigan]|uniref:Uncharacterized protein n=1 Tax=Mycoplasma ovis str. Michigan TaxID=1415773 RepID=A0ABN4BL98_9MOLU|nr:hypothetical protein [Mycoplasma ovis]AHC40151.1 hypothetical protein OVS_00815 [Mycoplasma ovis str. Michigan]
MCHSFSGSFSNLYNCNYNNKQQELITWLTTAGESISQFFQLQQQVQQIPSHPIDVISALTKIYRFFSEKAKTT